MIPGFRTEIHSHVYTHIISRKEWSAKLEQCFFRNNFKLHLSPFEREGIKQWIGSNRSGDTLGGKREWAASVASWRSEKRAFVLSRGGGGGGELGLEEEEEPESLAGGAGCQGQEQARRAAIRLLET